MQETLMLPGMRDYPSIELALRTAGRAGRAARSKVENFRDRQVRAVVMHAYENVAFYRRLYQEHGILPAKIRGTADLAMLPRISKRDLQSVPVADRISEGFDISRLRSQRTTGTTGEPLTVFRHRSESRLLALFYFQGFRSLGVKRSDFSAGIKQRVPGSQTHGRSFFRGVANVARFYPAVTVHADNAADALAGLKRLRPEVVGCPPGRLSRFAASWSDAEQELVRRASWPRMVVTGGETLKPSVRSHLSDVFGARVLDMYCTAEFNLMASECPATGAYHVCDESIVLEVRDGDRQVSAGEVGQPVVTGLHSFAAPLIRYEVTDDVTMGAAACECGASLSTLGKINGRSLDFFELPDGTVFTDVRIELAVAVAAPWARQSQVRQVTPEHIEVRVAPLASAPVDGAANLRGHLEKFFGSSIRLEVIIDPELGPRGAEKFRSMIRLNDAEPATR
jgi:phenylacetate-coenzyme A ligase PaaK-like adenylate-forming protein